MAKPVDWDELYPGKFLKAGEFQGKKVTLTIKDVDLEDLIDSEGKEKRKGVVSFAETPKMLALNKTNGLCIREMFGRKIPEWIGKKVILFPSTWNGEDCIRVWGSPDLAAEKQIEVKLPRRKPIPMTMHTSAK